jgi:hypothetical protein
MVEVDRLADRMKLEYVTFRANVSVVIKPMIFVNLLLVIYFLCFGFLLVSTLSYVVEGDRLADRMRLVYVTSRANVSVVIKPMILSTYC